MNKPHQADEVFLGAKQNEATGCLEWVGTLWGTGYGRFQMANKSHKAHRVAFESVNGPLPPGACLLHRCDNRKCINVDHLFIGSRRDNNLDKTAKGRQSKGVAINTAKIDEATVLSIRKDSRESKDIAQEVGLSTGHINKIRNGRAWAHV